MSQHGWGVTCERGTSHLEGSLRKPQKALEKPRAEDLGVRQSPSATLEKRLPLGEWEPYRRGRRMSRLFLSA